MQRAIRGDWVEWKPEIAPQATVMNMKLQIGVPDGACCRSDPRSPGWYRQVGEDTEDDADGHDDEADAEDGVDLADDRVNGDKSRDEVIHQDEDEPEQQRSEHAGCTALAAQLHDQARRPTANTVPTMMSRTTEKTRITFCITGPRYLPVISAMEAPSLRSLIMPEK